MIDGINDFEPMKFDDIPILVNRPEGSIISWPIKITKAIDLLFSHNELISLWYTSSSKDHVRLWIGEAWALPDEYKDLSILKFFGAIAEEIWSSDIINIIVDANDETPKNLPKLYHDSEGCSDNNE